jgi:nitrile hydratase accessory protein
MPARRRNIVVRSDGRPVNVARPRGQLFVCATGCCCGRTEDGFAAVPAELYHDEWERRRLRNVVHLTIGGCLGPCALANVVLLLLDGEALWFHGLDTAPRILALYDHIETMLEAGHPLPPPPLLAPLQFTASAWQSRPDGQPVDDRRPWQPGRRHVAPTSAHCRVDAEGPDTADPDARLHQRLGSLPPASVPRQNGELVFDAPWQGRVFGMAIALSEQGVVPWEEFRRALIEAVAAAEARGGEFHYYEVWLAAFERVLAAHGLVAAGELEEATYQFEFGERDDVF